MSNEHTMTQRRVENIVRSLTALEAEIHDGAFDCASCQAQPRVVDVVGWCKELLAEMLALRAEKERLQRDLSRSKSCEMCSGTGSRHVVLVNFGQCAACEGSGKRP